MHSNIDRYRQSSVYFVVEATWLAPVTNPSETDPILEKLQLLRQSIHMYVELFSYT